MPQAGMELPAAISIHSLSYHDSAMDSPAAVLPFIVLPAALNVFLECFPHRVPGNNRSFSWPYCAPMPLTMLERAAAVIGSAAAPPLQPQHLYSRRYRRRQSVLPESGVAAMNSGYGQQPPPGVTGF